MAGEPIKLGSASASLLIFQTGSSVSTSESGIQQCAVKALCPDAANVFSYIPTAGSNYASVFGNSFLPSDFKLDYTDSGATIDYSPGLTANVTLTFKRPDPNFVNARKITVDGAVKYVVLHSAFGLALLPPIHLEINEPVVTVRYTSIAPSLLTETQALPGTAPTAGFPDVPEFITLVIPGALIGQEEDVSVSISTVNPFWERTGTKWLPVAASSFFDVTETWRRGYYSIYGDNYT